MTLGIKALKDLNMLHFSYQQPSIFCPRCQSLLHEFCYPDTMVFIEACKTCNGIWLAANERKEIGRARDIANQMSCPKCHKQQAVAKECNNSGVIVESSFKKSREKLLIFAAIILVDFVHFEENQE